MALQTVEPLERVTVYSHDGGHKAYLEIVRDGSAIRVQPTLLGKKQLNRFWTMWLRKLLLEQAPEKRSYGIEVRRNNVRITSQASIAAMMGTVYQIAAQLQPIPDPPLVRHRWDDKNARSMRFAIKAVPRSILDEQVAAMPWGDILAGIQLPSGVHLKCRLEKGLNPTHGYGEVWLHYPLRHKRHLTGGQISMLLELEVALACHQ